jgi:hypothetical protein
MNRVQQEEVGEAVVVVMTAMVVMTAAHPVEEEGRRAVVSTVQADCVNYMQHHLHQCHWLNSFQPHKRGPHPPFQAHHQHLPRYVYASLLQE